MDAAMSSHPSDQTLSSYGLGKLDDGLAEAVNKHLEQCQDCRKRVAEMSADSFLERVRDAQKPSGKSTFGLSQAGGTQSSKGLNAPVPPPENTLPPGLADHPDYEIVRELGRGGMGSSSSPTTNSFTLGSVKPDGQAFSLELSLEMSLPMPRQDEHLFDQIEAYVHQAGLEVQRRLFQEIKKFPKNRKNGLDIPSPTCFV